MSSQSLRGITLRTLRKIVHVTLLLISLSTRVLPLHVINRTETVTLSSGRAFVILLGGRMKAFHVLRVI